MHLKNTSGAGRTEGPFVVRPEISAAVLCVLDQDRMPDDWTIGVERDAIIDRLMTAIKAGTSIDLAASRSAEAAAHDGGSRTIAGYLLALIRDKFIVRDLGDWHQFIALGSLAVDIEAAQV
jgi:hypothetical protein